MAEPGYRELLVRSDGDGLATNLGAERNEGTFGPTKGSTLGGLAGDLEITTLILEFSRAVVPLAGFIVLYTGIVLEQWLFTLEMAAGLACVIAGLAIFKLGLMNGLMPFGESIGQRLPEKAPLPVVVLTSLLLGVLVTFSEPGINSLQLVGEILHREVKGRTPGDALLMRVLNPRRSFRVLMAVACGVGIASAGGLLRLQYRWGIKPIIFCLMTPLLALTCLCWASPEASGIVGLSWDCGAITTGPATVPVVLSLGVGAARTSRAQQRGSDQPAGSDLDGFGIVTFASLVPVLTVMIYSVASAAFDEGAADEGATTVGAALGGRIWEEFPVRQLWQSCRAVVPLVAFLCLVQGLVIRERPTGVQPWPVLKGLFATFLGLFVFNIGLTYGSVPLGEMSGRTLPLALDSDTLFSRWGLATRGGWCGELVLMAFGFVTGFIATVIDLEPCGLGEAVEHLSGGRFTKRDLILSVAVGVGAGVALGFAKVLYGLNLLLVLVVGYAVALALTLFADEGLCCVAWDSAGVTTGPVTVPLVLSMGVGICCHVGSADGFGILACASVCPIISVLATAIVRSRARKDQGQAVFQRTELSEWLRPEGGEDTCAM